ncbi:Regulating synaptic membrane exocytosis protein 2 [Triplophysa tibetana]|uniref:Regulating synaptic membrane exocytosis protein 2 n=1 Tax=Triplophysa tibetana TaxID=1572043 RepID=A0A5A9MZG1_9TELE|nr:Regulating synaptic membrane exocytosis protein 2 [Triplophysa tibetana]
MYGVELNVRRDLKLPLIGDPGSAAADDGSLSLNEIAFDPDATAELMTAGIKSSPFYVLFMWFPFSGITDLVNNVLQPQTKSENQPQTDPPSKEPETKLHQQFESYKDQVKKMGEEAQTSQELKADAPTCGICHKTKFADGCGHLCSYCQTKFCARCGGRVSLRSNKVMWVCNLCRKQQEILTKSGAWFYSGGPEATLPSGASDPHRRHEEAPQEKKAKLQEAPLLYQGPPGERTRGPGLPRQASLNNDTLTNRFHLFQPFIIANVEQNSLDRYLYQLHCSGVRGCVGKHRKRFLLSSDHNDRESRCRSALISRAHVSSGSEDIGNLNRVYVALEMLRVRSEARRWSFA